jgi:hypothetical protein
MVSKGAIGSIVGLAVLVALVAAGCGGGGSDETVTKADFVRQGNAVCGKWQQARTKRFAEVNQKFKPPATQAKREKAILIILAPYEDAIQGLKELEPPAGEEEKVEAMIKAMEEGWNQAKADPGSLISNGVAFNKSNKLFEEYGLKECRV